MAWANCPTHGPIQDARPVVQAGEVVRLVCVCGLDCAAYEPQAFVDHDELKDLARSHRQPKEDHVTEEALLEVWEAATIWPDDDDGDA